MPFVDYSIHCPWHIQPKGARAVFFQESAKALGNVMPSLRSLPCNAYPNIKVYPSWIMDNKDQVMAVHREVRR